MRHTRSTRVVLSSMLAMAVLGAAPASLSAQTLLLPDLGMAPLADFTVQKRPKGERWLRFSAIIVNVGAGPFQTHATKGSDGRYVTFQEIKTSDGTWQRQETPGVRLYWGGDGHNHWHVEDLEQYVLQGTNTGARYGAKRGFCFWDNYIYNRNLPGYSGTAAYTSTNSCQTLGDTSVRMGLSIGWGDRYAYNLVDQYINITNLPAGEYTVTATADWDNWFAESNEGNNSTTARIRLSKSGVTVLDPGTGP